MQGLVEPGLVDRVHGANAHGDGGEFPEVFLQARVRVGGDSSARVGQFLAESVHLLLGEATFQEGARVKAGGGVTLVEPLVAAAGMIFPAEEVGLSNLVQGCCGGVGVKVTPDCEAGALGALPHEAGVAANAAGS